LENLLSARQINCFLGILLSKSKSEEEKKKKAYYYYGKKEKKAKEVKK
jgi:hypothetical protein